MPVVRRLTVCFTLLALTLAAVQAARACPFCQGGSGLTLAEEVAASDLVVLLQWVSGQEAGENTSGMTTYEVVAALRQQQRTPAELKRRAEESPKPQSAPLAGGIDDSSVVDAKSSLPDDHRTQFKKGDRITLGRYRTGKPGDLFLLMGTLNERGTAVEWGGPQEITEAGFGYISQAPSPEVDPIDRLRYFVKFLEFPDELVAGDAYREFAKAPYERIVPLAKDLSRAKIRGWLTDEKTPQVRIGLYGLMLGLCGDDSDARLMAEKISGQEMTDDVRLGIDGVMAGYLLLTGSKGLDFIDETKLHSRTSPVSETFAAIQAVRFMWQYASGRIEKDRLRTSLRSLVDRPELVDFVIPDLARWEDWSVQDRLMELYGVGEYDVPQIKQAIVQYMLASARPQAKGNGPEPERVAKGRKYLQTLREKDPETVANAERFSFQN